MQFGFTDGPLADGSYPQVDALGIYGVSNFDLATDVVDDGSGNPACRINVAPTPEQQAVLDAEPRIAALVAGCRPLNMLGLDNMDPAALDWVLGTQTEAYEFTQHIVGGNVTGDVAELWAGPLSLAAGGEYRIEDGETLHAAPVQYWSPDYGGDFLGEQKLLAAYVEADLPLFAAIEPFHGNQVVAYRPTTDGTYSRLVIDTELANGHSLLVADLSGDGNGEIVAAGTRRPQNLYLYRAVAAAGDRWERSIIDDAISANSCAAGDINGDGLTDVACIDSRAPNSLKWYENTGEW